MSHPSIPLCCRASFFALLQFAGILAISNAAFCTTLYVPDNYSTIQGAIDASTDGDTVIVRPGTYLENIDFKGKAIIVTSEFGSTVTTIDGGNPSNPDYGSVATFRNSEGPDTVLEGFTLTNGIGNIMWSSRFGGGAYCWYASPIIRNNTIKNNSADNGGGICCNYGDTAPRIEGNIISENNAAEGGGIYCSNNSEPTIVDNEISDNTATTLGGGISCDRASLLISDNSITGNKITDQTFQTYGGGIYLDGGDAVIRNNTISGNSVYYIGGGIYCNVFTSTIQNNTITDNSAGTAGGIYFAATLSLSIMEYNVISRNAADSGGGVKCSGSTSITVRYNDITDNIANLYGGGLYCSATTADILNNRIIGNRTTWTSGHTEGGGIYLGGDNVNCLNNLIVDNYSTGSGGGISIQSETPCFSNNVVYNNYTVMNGGGIRASLSRFQPLFSEKNTIADNSAGGEGGGIYIIAGDTEINLVDTILWNNSAPEGKEIAIHWTNFPVLLTVSYSDLEGGMASIKAGSGSAVVFGSGMIDANPLFIDPFNLDFHLAQDPCQPGVINPCVDTGDPDRTPIYGSTRTDRFPDLNRGDMGFHETGILFVVPDDFSSIQLALDNAADSLDTILVKPGIYLERIDYLGKAVFIKSVEGTAATVIDGMSLGSVVSFISGESESSTLDGFTIRNGLAACGGGILCQGSSPTIRANVITENRAIIRGGGLACESSCASIVNNVFWENIAATEGGGIHCLDSSIDIVNNTLYANSAVSSGGGLFCNSSTPTIINTILWDNSAAADPEIGGSSPVVTFCDVKGGWPGTGNIDIDPFLVDPAKGDFHLDLGSACFNAGSNTTPKLPDLDFEGQDRVLFGVVDIGADEYSLGNVFLVPQDYTTIQDAINTAVEGDTILVDAGIYVENIDFLGKNVVVTSKWGPHCTIIDGNQAGTVVTFQNHETENAVLQGFLLTNGEAVQGGGIYCSGSSPTISRNVVEGNKALQEGGGIYIVSSDVVLVNNIIVQNSAVETGGGIDCYSSNLVATNNTISNNQAGSRGGGIGCRHASTAEIYNTILWKNRAPEGNEIVIQSFNWPSTLSISYSNLEGGQASIHVAQRCTLNWGPSMFDSDPLFAGGDHNDVHLTYDSICRDTSTGTAPYLPSEDFEGDPRDNSSTVDRGADEFHRHIYHAGPVIPGSMILVKVVGIPSTTPVHMGLGAGIRFPPLSTIHGDLFLEFPIQRFSLGTIPQNGVIELAATVPGTWIPGEQRPLQSLVGQNLSNLMIMLVK